MVTVQNTVTVIVHVVGEEDEAIITMLEPEARDLYDQLKKCLGYDAIDAADEALKAKQ